MIRYTYLLIDVMSVLVPLICSFHPRIRLYRDWYALLPVILVVAAGYALWDSLFVHLGMWGFNPRYIMGIYIGNLPVEELLFFICIPYACVFTYACLSAYLAKLLAGKNSTNIGYALSIMMVLIAVLAYPRAYTSSAFGLMGGLILLGTFLKIRWLPVFYLVYVVLLVPFLIVNGLLTGTGLAEPVVWYSASGIIGLRIMTIPVEDVFYGMGLIMLNIWLYTFLKEKKEDKAGRSIINN